MFLSHIMVFSKKLLSRTSGPFWGPKIIFVVKAGSAVGMLFLILRNERGQELNENHFNGFSEKLQVLGKWTFLSPKLMPRHNTLLRLF